MTKDPGTCNHARRAEAQKKHLCISPPIIMARNWFNIAHHIIISGDPDNSTDDRHYRYVREAQRVRLSPQKNWRELSDSWWTTEDPTGEWLRYSNQKKSFCSSRLKCDGERDKNEIPHLPRDEEEGDSTAELIDRWVSLSLLLLGSINHRVHSLGHVPWRIRSKCVFN